MMRCALSVSGMVLAISSAGALHQGALNAAPEPRPLSGRPGEPANTWVLLSPLEGGPPSPRLGYEGACVYDTLRRVLIRYGGHNQGGGGEQHAEVWIFDPRSARWDLREPDTSPPGICCGQQNVFDPARGVYVRFPAFSGSHGWQWRREIELNDASVWTYDPAADSWKSRRPLPAPRVRPLRSASWDEDHGVIVLFGGEGSNEGTAVYDPYANTWTPRHPREEPAPRSAGNMAYDRARRLHVLFGAQFQDDPHTWLYDLRRNIWRDARPVAQPPTDRNDAVLAYDDEKAVVVAVIKVTQGEDEDARHRLETWAYDAGANEWRAMKPEREPDPSGNRARVLQYAPDLGGVLLENRTHPPHGKSEQQIWLYRHPGPAAPAAGPRPPAPSLSVTREGARLAWPEGAGGDGPRARAWAVYRGTGTEPWSVELAKVAETTRPEHVDASLPRGVNHYYRVHALAADGKEGPGSFLVQTRPRAVEEVTVTVRSASEVEVGWSPPPESRDGEIEGYIVERAAVEVVTDSELKGLAAETPPLEAPAGAAIRRVGSFERLTREPRAGRRFLDAVDITKPAPPAVPLTHERSFDEEDLDPKGRPYPLAVYAYRIRAVNVLGVASGPSPAVLTLPAAPSDVFAREDGQRALLRWKAQPEAGLRGYRVYRLDGRYSKEPVSRLTPEPLSEPAFTDETAGEGSRRYYIVAVDALGQEGHPSAPVWHRREWAKFYEPFTGEWHQ
jgi:hypothetical protein